MKAAYAVVGPVLAIGDPTSVKAVDRHRRQDGPQHQRPVPGGRGVRHRRPPRLRLRGPRDPRQERDGPRRCRRRRHAVAADLARGPDPAVGRRRRPRRGRRVRHGEPLAARGVAPGPRPTPSPSCRASCRRPPCSSPRATTWARRSSRSRTSSPTRPSSRSPSPSSTMPSRSSAAPRPSPAGWARPASRSRSTATEIAGGLVVVPTDAAAADKLLEPAQGLHPARRRPGRPHRHRGGLQRDARSRSSTCRASAASSARMSEGAVAAPTDLKLAYAVTDEVVVFGYRDRLREERPRRERRRVARRHRALQHGADPGRQGARLAVLAGRRGDPRLRRGHGPGRRRGPTTTRSSSRTSRRSIP